MNRKSSTIEPLCPFIRANPRLFINVVLENLIQKNGRLISDFEKMLNLIHIHISVIYILLC